MRCQYVACVIRHSVINRYDDGEATVFDLVNDAKRRVRRALRRERSANRRSSQCADQKAEQRVAQQSPLRRDRNEMDVWEKADRGAGKNADKTAHDAAAIDAVLCHLIGRQARSTGERIRRVDVGANAEHRCDLSCGTGAFARANPDIAGGDAGGEQRA